MFLISMTYDDVTLLDRGERVRMAPKHRVERKVRRTFGRKSPA